MRYDVVVVGAGPAGSACAYELARSGYHVLVAEKHALPRDKACGDGLTPRAIEALERMDLADVVAGCLPVLGIRFTDMATMASAEVPFADGSSYATGGVLPRRNLDQLLCEAAREAGAEIRTSTFATALTHPGTVAAPTAVTLVSGESTEVVLGRFVVIAEGSAGRLGAQLRRRPPRRQDFGVAVRQYFRISRDAAPLFEIYAPLGAPDRPLPGYAWVFPVGRRLVNVGIGILRTPDLGDWAGPRRLLAAFAARLAERQALGRMEPCSPVAGAPLRMGLAPEEAVEANVLAVGDAAGLVNPFTGEGIAYALESGALASQAIGEVLTGAASGPAAYADRLAQRFRRHVKLRPALDQIYRLYGRRGSVSLWKPRPVEGTAAEHLASVLWDRRGREPGPLVDLLLRALGSAVEVGQSNVESALFGELEEISPVLGETIYYTRDDTFLLPRYRSILVLAAASASGCDAGSACRVALAIELANLALRLYADVGAHQGGTEDMLATLAADALLVRAFQHLNRCPRTTAVETSHALQQHMDRWTSRYALGDPLRDGREDGGPAMDGVAASLVGALRSAGPPQDRRRFDRILECAAWTMAAAETAHDLWLDYGDDSAGAGPHFRLLKRRLAGRHARTARRRGVDVSLALGGGACRLDAVAQEIRSSGAVAHALATGAACADSAVRAAASVEGRGGGAGTLAVLAENVRGAVAQLAAQLGAGTETAPERPGRQGTP